MVDPKQRFGQGHALDGNLAVRYACGHMNQQGLNGAAVESINETARRGRPWWQMCCGGCLLLVVAAIIGTVILLQTLAGPGIVHLTALPANFPSQITPLHPTEVRSMDYLEGRNKTKVLQTLYAPFRLFTKMTGRQTTEDGFSLTDVNSAFDSMGSDVQKIDTVTMTWKSVRATQPDLLAQYTQQFNNAGLTLKTSHDDADRSDVVTGLREGLFVQLSLKGGVDPQVVDEIQLVVSYSNK